MHSFTEENYLKVIFHLFQVQKMPVQTNAIAGKLNTRAASVTDMLKKLADKKLINYIRYQGVTLTEQGKSTAIQIIRRHRLWEVFLVEKLNFGWDEVHDIAEELEHVGYKPLIERLDKFLGYPKRDPHGDLIPDSSGEFEIAVQTGLLELPENTRAIIIGVTEHSSPYLKHLERLGLTIGESLLIEGITSYDGTLELNCAGNKISISRKVAQHILVSTKNQ